jgi:sugar lactone lactonase YvrE
LRYQGAKQLNNSIFGRPALGLSVAAAFLAGCGAPQAPLAAPGSTPLQAQARAASAAATIPVLRPALESLGHKATAPLLYVSNDGEAHNVTVYRADSKDPNPIETISDDLDFPVGMCLDGQGTLYVVDDDGWVAEYPAGKTKPSKIITKGINTPAFCAIDSKGNLWVTNISGPNVTEYLPGSTKPHAVITKGITYPDGIAIDHSGNMYVGNLYPSSSPNIQVFAHGSKSPSREITDGLTTPVGITVDAHGTLYVANEAANNVEEYRSGQNEPYQTITDDMDYPVGLTVNQQGWLYVVNHGNEVVVEFAPGSTTASNRQISKGLYNPVGTAYSVPLLP